MSNAATYFTSSERPIIRHADDVSAIINNGPQGKSHANIVVALALGGVFLDAYDLTTLSYGIEDVKSHFHLSNAAVGLVAAALNAGTIIGSLVGGWLTDRIGRYAVFMADMACFVVAALVAGFAPSATILILARLAMGFGVGMDLPVAMAFLAEFSKLSGKGSKASRAAAWCPVWYAASSACFLLVFGLSNILPSGHPDWLWRGSLAFGAVPALLIIFVRGRYMSESPLWLARQGDLEKAAAILRKSHGVDPVLEIPVAEEEIKITRPNPLFLFKKPLLRRTILINIMTLSSAFSYSAIAFQSPSLLRSILHLDTFHVLIATIVLNLVFAFTGGLIGVRLTRVLSSRSLSIAGYVLQVVSLAALALASRSDSVLGAVIVFAGFAGFLFAQGFGPGCQLMVYPTLSYPTELRGSGIGLARLLSGIGATVALAFLPKIYAAFGSNFFWIVLFVTTLPLVTHFVLRWEVFGYDTDTDLKLRPHNA
ncbi:MFS transporter [Neokomagataea thailandica]|uniref:Sugar transporter n=1 Tax=Neokomagataea tanensis NBRC 106556 TaxID=1223519 RepID=A0ABQ0QJV2_9PROT|nr:MULTISPECIES: MFS transporter [Neokomagataea]GBR47410.1 sugar transporter [Neokomagataea tanensis NBRC 106556]